MDFELNISGLCVLVLRGNGNPRPTTPSSVDVLCVGPHQGHHHGHDHMGQPMHSPRLSYLPGDLLAADGVVADLVIDQTGRRIASLDLTGKVLGLDLGGNPHAEISVSWGPVNSILPANATEEAWLNWVPSIQDLGFTSGLQLGGPGAPVAGAGAVLSLPNGILSARNIVRMVQPPDIIEWQFPAAGGIRRAIANDVVFRANGVEDVVVLVDGSEALTSSSSGGLLQMSISNDLAVVGPDFPQGSMSLDHLSDIAALPLAPGRPQFSAPRVPSAQRTGHPICNQALFII